MADKVIEKKNSWFSAELSVLEAEFEKSKLQVFQGTLLCKRSMVELELLCKNERLRKNVRVNNKFKEKDSRLQEQLESLSSDLKNAASQLQTAQNSLQDEKARHQSEKKELEQKLNSEMETRLEEQRETANKRENLLQEELKTLQNKHLKIFKEAEDLRAELSKKNVAVKTKAIQAMVNVKNTSTMVQVDSQTCEVGVQVQDLALVDDRSRIDGDDVRKVNEDLRKTSETSKEKNRVAEAKRKASKEETLKENGKDTDKCMNVKTKKKTAKGKTVPKCKEVDKDEGKENGMIYEEGANKRKVLRKSSQPKSVTSQTEANAIAEEHQTATLTQEELHLEKQSTSETGKCEEFLHEIANRSDSSLVSSASQGDEEVPFQYRTTPKRLQKLEENNQSVEQHGDIASACIQHDITCSVEEGNNSTKRSEVALIKKSDQSKPNKEKLENAKEVLEVKEDCCVTTPPQERSVENENVASEEQKSAATDEDRDSFELDEARRQPQDGQESLADSERTVADKGIQGEKVPGVQDVNEEMRKNGKKDSKRRPTARQTKSSEEEIQGEIQENSTVKSDESQGRRVLRSMAKECSSGVELDTKKGKKRKALGTKTRQKTQVSVMETVMTNTCKTDRGDLKGRELTILDKSTPETDLSPRETDMSSREIDRLVDEPRPSREVTTGTPARDETSQQPEPEALGRLNKGKTCSQGECLQDYTSDQGRLVLDVNRISTLEERIFDNCLHKDLEEGKFPCQNGQGSNDVSESKKQGSDCIEADSNTHLTRQTRSTRDRRDPAGVSDLAAVASSKENASDGKQKGRKKRKPTSSTREVLAPADQQSNSDCRTSSSEIPSMLDCTKRRKTLFNSRENSLMAPISNVQMSFANTTLSKSRANAGIPPSLSAFMKSFIAPKLKKSQ